MTHTVSLRTGSGDTSWDRDFSSLKTARACYEEAISARPLNARVWEVTLYRLSDDKLISRSFSG